MKLYDHCIGGGAAFSQTLARFLAFGISCDEIAVFITPEKK